MHKSKDPTVCHNSLLNHTKRFFLNMAKQNVTSLNDKRLRPSVKKAKNNLTIDIAKSITFK